MSYINTELVGNSVFVWERNGDERVLQTYDAPWTMYVQSNKGEHNTLHGEKATKFEFGDRFELKNAVSYARSRGKKTYESDLAPDLKILSEHYYQVAPPNLHVTYLDIEVDYDPDVGFSSIDNPYAPVNACAFYQDWNQKSIVVAVPPESWGKNPKKWEEMLDQSLRELATIEFYSNEVDLLNRMVEIMEEADALCGWNSSFFDFPYITKRVERVLGKRGMRRLGFPGASLPKFREIEIMGRINQTVNWGGRVLLDYLDLFKKFEMTNRPSYSLENISNEILPDLPKLEYEGTLAELYNKDFNHFLRYNIRDTECLKGFEDELGYVALANEMVHNSTGRFRDVLGTIKLAEMSIINYCHYVRNVIVPDCPDVDDTGNDEQAEGAYVLEPKAGLQELIGSVDINSLYPSAIRSINISPETLIGQFTTEVQAFEEIRKRSLMNLTLVFEDQTYTTMPAADWRQFLLESGWAISGFGTVYNQAIPGVIPQILTEWFATRKEYQAKKKAAEAQRKALVAKYKI